MASTPTVPPPGEGLVVLVRAAARTVSENKVLGVAGYFGAVFLKVLAAAHGDLPTALGILSASSLPVVVSGATLSALPIVALDLITVLVYLLIAGYWHGRWMPPVRGAVHRSWPEVVHHNRILIMSIGVLTVSAVFLPPVTLLVASVAIAAVCAGFARLAARRRPRRMPARRTRPSTETHATAATPTGRVVHRVFHGPLGAGLTAVLVLAVATTMIQVVKTVWVPHEALYEPNGKAFVGYVLDDSNGRIVLLRSHSRDLRIVSDATISTQVFCRADDKLFGVVYRSQSLWGVLAGSASDVRCPDNR